jgi:hypothetical protein
MSQTSENLKPVISSSEEELHVTIHLPEELNPLKDSSSYMYYLF